MVGLLLAGLVALASAAHFEFDSRDSLYDARDYVNVPFQLSLRAFLEGAVPAHKHTARALALADAIDGRAPADLEARVFGLGKTMQVEVRRDKGASVHIQVGENDTGAKIKKKIKDAIQLNKGETIKLKSIEDIKRLYVGTNQKAMDVLTDGAKFWSFTGEGKGDINTLWMYTTWV
ncbi:hypothetical protein DFP72DRAFT_1081638 [Ephemerocybe angulata]|uniref:Uncharacterized protein n=1 Tax=Ephemerocybe angulata TaxID=980116 RepID=A0A8H6H950_9AGAR|nr:hypothetical protein DFP72DRAFT_1081638 [Tulosesus angulatus]